MILLVAALAIARLTRLVTKDEFPPVAALRDRLLARWPAEDTAFAEQADAKVEVFRVGEVWVPEKSHWLGDLITCPWCAGFWIASLVTLGLWGFDALTLPWAVWWLLPWAFSMVAGLLASWE